MRFALYHPWVYLRSGVERMIVELATRSDHEWTIFTHHLSLDTVYPEVRNLDIVELEPGVSVRRSAGPIGSAAATIATTRLPDVGASALLVSSEGLGDLVAARARLPMVAYCHTPLKIVHDPHTRRRLRERDAVRHAATVALGPLFTGIDRRMWRRFEHVFVNSEEVRRRVDAARLRPRGEVEVLHPGVDLAGEWGIDLTDPPVELRDGRVEARFVVAGRIMWQKRIELAIAALASGLERGHRWELDIVGAVDEKSRPYLAELRRAAAGLPVRFHLDRPDHDVRALLSAADAMVFTPPNEDFGMVVLEALSVGTPVIAAARGGPAEILTPESGWLVHDDVAGVTAAMAQAARDPQHKRRGARERSEHFAWDPFVRRVDEVMEAVGSRRAVPRR